VGSNVASEVLTHRHIRPWTQAYEEEYKRAASQGAVGEEKLKYALPDKFGEGLSIIFHDDTKCRVLR
jgi:hypothetical protein